ncbi:MAG: two pore domain potassium channel family protein [Synechococcales cyanobacterium T60_A2020_003]|nr:two pore domain potassium channel family protein [Synechococcales cyanobacterium T60_A2020_003]
MDSFIKHESFRRVLTGSLFFALTIIIAVTGYTLAGWSLLDAIYMVVITIFGVGYGEVNPITSPALKVFTMMVIIGGTSSAVYIVGGFLQMVTEGEIYRAFHEARMTKGNELPRRKRTGYQNQKRASCSSRCNWRYSLP